MEYLFGILSGYITNPTYMVLLFVVLVIIAVFLFILSIYVFFSTNNSNLKRRLDDLDSLSNQIQQPKVLLTSKNDTAVDQYLDPLSQYLTPQKEKEKAQVVQKLKHAGFHHRKAIIRYYALKTGLAIVLPCFTLIYFSFYPSVSQVKAIYGLLMSAAVGIFTPNYILEYLLVQRQRRLREGFPDFLDLLVVCIESGMSLDMALIRVTKSIEAGHESLSEEFSIVCNELSVGKSRIDALKGLVDRTGLVEIKGLVAVMDQSVRFGTSLADALRVYSDEFRDKRSQDAEARAAKIGAKLLFPMLLCLWPSFFIVCAGPAVIKLFDAFK